MFHEIFNNSQNNFLAKALPILNIKGFSVIFRLRSIQSLDIH